MTQTAQEMLQSGALAGSWTLDPAGSSATFHSKHYWGVVTVHGCFTHLDGAVTVSMDGTATGTIIIDSTEFDTKSKARDKALRGEEFFDVEHYPAITFAAKAAAVDSNGELTITGDLTVRGQTKSISVPVRTDEVNPDAVTLSADLVVDRADFGIPKNPLGIAPTKTRVEATTRFVRLTQTPGSTDD